MDLEELIAEKEFYIDVVKQGREEIANLKREKALMKPPLWEEATGTVDQKKDYIKSKTAEIDREILIKESNVEYAYNMIDSVNDKLVLCDE